MANNQAKSSDSRNPQLETLLVEALIVELTDSTPKEREDALSMLKLIFDNIIQHPNEDKYRQIKLTDEPRFVGNVWRYPAGVKLMTMSGWEEDGDYVRLKDDSHVEAMAKLLEQKLQRIRISTPHSTDPLGTKSSSECCVFTKGKINVIACAVLSGNGGLFRELLRPYHFACFNNAIRGFYGLSILEFACFSRQIGIARILANEYAADFSSSNKDEVFIAPFFKACDSTELCQSSIVQFIKEFKIDVHSYHQLSALHLAILHKLPTVVKFLVEDCKINVNCVSKMRDFGAPLHWAYGIGEESIALYLIEHGADEDTLDGDGRKPIDYKFHSTNRYSNTSDLYIKQRILYKRMDSDEYIYLSKLRNQGYGEEKATELTFKKFQSLQENLVCGIANDQKRPTMQKPGYGEQEATELTFKKFQSLQENLVCGIANDQNRPTMQKLNHYIKDMAPSYQTIGLELGVPYATLKLIRNDPNFLDLKEKCREMLHVWLENDISATWKKLCDALQQAEMSVFAEQIKSSLQI